LPHCLASFLPATHCPRGPPVGSSAPFEPGTKSFPRDSARVMDGPNAVCCPLHPSVPGSRTPHVGHGNSAPLAHDSGAPDLCPVGTLLFWDFCGTTRRPQRCTAHRLG